MPRPTKTLGVLGGMGPAAAAEFLRLLAQQAPAQDDSQHPRILLLSDPNTPDRSDALLGSGPDPTPVLQQNLLRLADWGAELLAVPCNTAHAFIDRFRASLPVPLVHIVEATVAEAKKMSPQGSWLLATSGTLHSGLYPAYAARLGHRFLSPAPAQQARVQASLRAVKAGNLHEAGQMLKAVVEELWAQEDLPVVTACTELPLAYAASGLPPQRQTSSLQALASATLAELYGG